MTIFEKTDNKSEILDENAIRYILIFINYIIICQITYGS